MGKKTKHHHHSKPQQNAFISAVDRAVLLQSADTALAHTQMCLDASMMANNKVFNMGPSRAPIYCDAFSEFFLEIVDMFADDTADAEYSRAKVDSALKRICGPNFQPWDERYERSAETIGNAMFSKLLQKIHALEAENKMLKWRLYGEG